MVRAYLVVPEFINRDFDAAYLQNLRNQLMAVRNSNTGAKVSLRVTYNFPLGGGGGNYHNSPDASITQIERHIAQLGPIFNEFDDVVVGAEAGFIGAWGEWHQSRSGHDRNPDSMRRVVDGWMRVLSPNQLVYVRYPNLMYTVYPGAMTPAEAYSGTNRSRMGHYNDCFLANETDAGTYNTNPAHGIVPPTLNTIARQQEYLAAQTQFTETTGETCGDVGGARFSCANARREMDLFNHSFLYFGDWGGLNRVLREQGCYDEVSRSLGYRFVLRRATLSGSVQPGGTLAGSIQIENVGYANMARYRPVELILRRDGRQWAVRLPVDPRRFMENVVTTIPINVGIPHNMPAGNYEVLLKLPDRGPALYANPRYAVRLANVNTWEETTGNNRLNLTISVAPGSQTPAYTGPFVFEVKGNTPIQACFPRPACLNNNTCSFPTPREGWCSW